MKRYFLILLLMFFVKPNVLADNLVIPQRIMNNEYKNKQTLQNFEDKLKQQKMMQSINWAPYMRKLEYNIKSNWKPIEANETNRVVVQFVVGKNGELLDNKIIRSSNIEEVDKRALETVEKTAPFEKLPREFVGESVPIQFTFDYNIINSRKLNTYSNNLKFYPEYCANVQKKILANLKSAQISFSGPVSIGLIIGRHGELIKVKNFSSVMATGTEEDLLEIIKESAPFESLPNDFKGENMKVLFQNR